ncbi:MAG TPA: LON peptidase substrate-binding domain-containing protein [Candidatus Limnocylindrales bacterium]|nr:LON peptidase substrate-binding domain-containing protein [Candidatus Limnocylindrales bacterium]
MELALFPLHTVLCPGVALPLKVFEERYRAMVQRCLERDEPFGVVLIRDGREVGPGASSIATVGTIAEIREASKYSDGRYDLLVVGTTRFRIESVAVGRQPYLVADVSTLDEPVGDPELAEQLTSEVTQRFVRYLGLLQPAEGEDGAEIDVQVEVDLEDDESTEGEVVASQTRSGEDVRVTIPDDPTVLSHLLSGIIQVDQPRRQDLLEAETTVDRIEELLRLIEREITLLERRLRNYTVDPRLAATRRN